MEILVTSKRGFDSLMKTHNITDENVESRSDTFFISINSTLPVPQSGEEDEPPYFSQNYANVLVQRFDDLEEDIYRDGKLYAKAFTSEQATEMVKFILKNQHRKKCVVHCAAGVSRSGAVGTFINDYYGESLEVFKKINPHIHPNVHVKVLLGKALYEIDRNMYPNAKR